MSGSGRWALTRGRESSVANGARHWLWQRITAVALAPLTIWFVISFVGLIATDHHAYSVWIGTPLNAILMIALVASLFTHIALGLQVVVEDYLHVDRIKRIMIVSLRLGCLGLAVGSSIAIMRMLISLHG